MGKRKKKNKGKPRRKIIGDVFKTKKGGLRIYKKKRKYEKRRSNFTYAP